MVPVVITMVFILAVAMIAVGVVVVGMQGRLRTVHPRIAHRLAVLAHHLNGEAEPPVVLQRFISPRH